MTVPIHIELKLEKCYAMYSLQISRTRFAIFRCDISLSFDNFPYTWDEKNSRKGRHDLRIKSWTSDQFCIWLYNLIFVPYIRASHHFTYQFNFIITTMNMLCNKVKDLGNPDSVFNNSDQSSQIQPPVPLASEPVRDPLTDHKVLQIGSSWIIINVSRDGR